MKSEFNTHRRLFLYPIALALALSIAVWTRAEPPANNGYYMLVFAAQAEPNVVRRSHSFALFVHVNDSAAPLETHCISWMPKSRVIQPLRMLPEAGVNLDLRATLDWARSVHARVTAWGPFAISKELYDKAVAREKQLNSGVVEYLCMDRRYRGELASNCIHAISDLNPSILTLDTGTAYGNSASEMIVDHFGPSILAAAPADWLVDRLGLKAREIQFESGVSPANLRLARRDRARTGIESSADPQAGTARHGLRP
jgi:hypothetical protein